MRIFLDLACTVFLLMTAIGCNSHSEDGAAGAGGPIKYNHVKDPKTGMVQYRSPIPENWEVHGPDDPVYISSPQGVKVHKSERHEFGWSSSPFMRQTIQQTGKQVAPPAPLQQVVEQQLKPRMRSRGYRFVSSSDAPGAKGLWQRLFAAMPQTGNRRDVEALSTEWEGGNGTRSMVLLIKTTTQSPQSMFWQVMTTEVEAPEAQYESAKSAYLYAVGNTELNPQWLAASGQALRSSIRETKEYWDNAAAISRQAHQQRMQAIESRGATARSAGETYSDILDISHQGYLTRDRMNSDGHSRTVNAIRNTTVIGNRETGERYNVDGNNKFYWVNNKGAYIATDNALFDPRVNENTKNEQWSRFQKEQ